MSPQIMSHWTLDPARHAKLFPMDMRPQAHEIIRTWLFYTDREGVAARARDSLDARRDQRLDPRPGPQEDAQVEGQRRPRPRTCSTSTRPTRCATGRRARGSGVDTTFDEQVMKLGRRLATKLVNAGALRDPAARARGRDAETHIPPSAISHPLDRRVRRSGLRERRARATASFDGFEYAAALQATEEAFWDFCDNYLEIVKVRAYAESRVAGARSALATLQLALRVFLRLLAPALPVRDRGGLVVALRRQRGRPLDSRRAVAERRRSSPACALERAGARTPPRARSRPASAARRPPRRRACAGRSRGSRCAARETDLAALQAVLSDVLAAGVVDTTACRLVARARPAMARSSRPRSSWRRRPPSRPSALARQRQHPLGLSQVRLVEHLAVERRRCPCPGSRGTRRRRGARARPPAGVGLNARWITATWSGWIAILPVKPSMRARAQVFSSPAASRKSGYTVSTGCTPAATAPARHSARASW